MLQKGRIYRPVAANLIAGGLYTALRIPQYEQTPKGLRVAGIINLITQSVIEIPTPNKTVAVKILDINAVKLSRNYANGKCYINTSVYAVIEPRPLDPSIDYDSKYALMDMEEESLL